MAAEETIAAPVSAAAHAQAESAVKNTVIGAMAAGLVPIPMVGLIGLVGANVAMLNALSKIYGVPFKQQAARSAVLALISGLVPVSLGVGVSEVLKLIPGFGSLAGATGTSLLAGAVTYGVGRSFIQHFESGGTFLTMDSAAMRQRFAAEFNNGRKVVAGWLGPKATPAESQPSAQP
jgi:uncharacterized protein (DUF697 family)